MNYNDSNTHVIKTSAQWNERAIEYWVVPRGCLCVELTPKGKTKIKIGEGNKNYYQLPYIGSSEELYNYYTKEEVDALLNNFNRMAIMSTDEYPSKRDLPTRGNKVGDVRFVAPSSPDIKPDPDLYVWDGHRWIYTGSPLVDMSEYVKTTEFNIVKNKVDQIFPMAHTHTNKAVLDNITQEKLDEIDGLAEMYDGVKTDITDLKSKSHTHSNKSILDSITQSSLWTQPDRDKFNSLHNYDDTQVKFRLVTLEEKAHTHANKTVLDGITQEKLDAIDELAATYVIVTRDIADLKTKSHTHANKDLLDGTTASFTVEHQNELYRLSQISTFIGAGPTWNGVMGYVPAPLAGDENKFLRGDGTWATPSGSVTYAAGDGITFTHPGMTDLGFDFDAFVAKIASIHYGTKTVDSEHKVLTLTATGDDCYTQPYSNTSAQDVYTFPIVAGHVYRLTWDSSNPSVSGRVFAFENVSETNLHWIDQSVQDYLEFTAVTSGTINFRFGVKDSGNTISYSNIHFYEIDDLDPNTTIINADIAKGLEFDSLDKLQVSLGDGLHFDSNDAIKAKLGDGLQFDANGAIEAISSTQYVRVNTTDSYVLLHTKPADWDDHWDKYFELTYDEITTSPPDWDPTQHYKYENDNYVLGTAGDTFVSTTWYDKHYVGLDPTTAVTFDSDVYYTGELHLIEDGETYDTAFAKINEAIEHIERLEGEVSFLHDEKIGVRTNSTPEQIEFYNT